MIRRIVTNLVELRQKSEPIEDPHELAGLVNDLVHTLDIQNQRAVGLAAPQIGIKKQVSLIRCGQDRFFLINPVIVEHSYHDVVSNEGCLSLPGLSIPVDRWVEVTVESGVLGRRVTKTYTGYTSIVVQHEIDHLMGKTILDRKHRRRR
jgi:peptide deformylase